MLMILILSYKGYEQGTDPVSEWLLYYKYPFRKIVVEDLLTSHLLIDAQKGEVVLDGVNLTKEVHTVFYRRFKKNLNTYNGIDLGTISDRINKESSFELNSTIDFFFFLLKDKLWIPQSTAFSVNKEIVLFTARKLGLNVPKSIVTTSKSDLIKFRKLVKGVIYKPIEFISYYQTGYYTYNSYTTPLSRAMLNRIPDTFFPSLFQELIDAEYEIRIFYLDEHFYSSAVLRPQFSNDHNVDIKLDFDKIETDWVAYELPNDVKEKIILLMKTLELITGSIDIIKCRDGKYYFLEVNPVGQYLAPSYLCNYNIPKIISEWLIEKDKNMRI